jgi:hypothetical protein
MLQRRKSIPFVVTQKERKRKKGLRATLLFRFKLLVRRFHHLVLLRQVDPQLEAAGLGLAGFLDRHFGVDDWDIAPFSEVELPMHFKCLLPRPCDGEMRKRDD